MGGSPRTPDYSSEIGQGLSEANRPKSDLAKALEGASISYLPQLFNGLMNGGQMPHGGGVGLSGNPSFLNENFGLDMGFNDGGSSSPIGAGMSWNQGGGVNPYI